MSSECSAARRRSRSRGWRRSVAWTGGERPRSTGSGTTSTGPTTETRAPRGADGRVHDPARARGSLRALARARPGAERREERGPRGGGDGHGARRRDGRDGRGAGGGHSRARNGDRRAGSRRAEATTEAAGRAAKSQSRFEKVYRRAMSALIADADLREVAASGSSTGGSRAQATTSARSPSASGTPCSSSDEPDPHSRLSLGAGARFAPGPLCALVGEAGSGKSNVLSAVWLLPLVRVLAAGRRRLLRGRRLVAPRRGLLRRRDGVARGAAGRATVASGVRRRRCSSRPPCEATIRSPAGTSEQMLELVGARSGRRSRSDPAVAFVDAMEACCATEITGVVLLIEEPELFLRPQAQRPLYRLLRDFASAGNEVIYSTHAPAFLNVARLEELAFVEQREQEPRSSSRSRSPRTELPRAQMSSTPSAASSSRPGGVARRRANGEARFPFVFRALGYDPDREGISIVECGGSPTSRCSRECVRPSVFPTWSSTTGTRRPVESRSPVSGRERFDRRDRRAGATIVLEPDFEAVAGLVGETTSPSAPGGASAWKSAVPARLAEVVHRVLQRRPS